MKFAKWKEKNNYNTWKEEYMKAWHAWASCEKDVAIKLSQWFTISMNHTQCHANKNNNIRHVSYVSY